MHRTADHRPEPVSPPNDKEIDEIARRCAKLAYERLEALLVAESSNAELLAAVSNAASIALEGFEPTDGETRGK